MRLVVNVAGLVAAATLFSGCTMTKDTTEPATLSAAPASLPQPPVAARVDHEITQLGRTRNDPYNWLKDENWQEVMRDPALLKPEEMQEWMAGSGHWDFQPFAGQLIVTPCESPLLKPKSGDSQQELF